MKSETDRLKKRLRAKKPGQPGPRFDLGLGTGITTLNLALTGRPTVGLLRGCYYLLVGDSRAGKTWLSHQILAEAAHNDLFDDYALVFDDPERGALMDVVRYFGSKTAKRVRPPRRGNSKYITDLYRSVQEEASAGSCVYVIDSEDALLPPPEAASKKGFRTEKAQVNSSGLRAANNVLEEHGSILIVVKQTRDNIGPGAMFNPKTRSGGRALTFYATAELWFSVRGKIKKTVRGSPRVIGTGLAIGIKKNRGTGREWVVEAPFYPSHGFDDIGACIDYLVGESYWKEKDGKVEATDLDFTGSVEKLAQKVEAEGREGELRLLVASVWQEVEEACSVERKRRYE